MDRPVLLFKSKPPHPADAGQWFTSDASAIAFSSGGAVKGVRLTGAEAARIRPIGGRWRVPDRIAARAETIPDAEVERYGAMQQLYAEARHMRRSLAIHSIDCSTPGELAPVARTIMRHVPEAAARLGVPIESDEGGSDMRQFAVDLQRMKPIAELLSRQVDTAAMTFAVRPTTATRIMLEMAERDATPARMAAFVSAGRQQV